MNARILPSVLIALACSMPVPATAQAPVECGMPPLPPVSKEPNIFTPEQAIVLGDIVIQQVARRYKLVRDPALDAYAQRIADRMAGIAGTGAVHVELLDLPQVNAMTLPGGRILLSRKLIAFAKTEDELAGVLAHEFGHLVARDSERTFSTWLRRALNVTIVGDARDIEDKYNRMVDNQARMPVSTSQRESENEQRLADQRAIWLMARAGYAPQAYVDIWDRYNGLHSNTGSWLGDLFGTTTPETKRLRVVLKATAALPATCVGTRPTTEEQFAQWQRAVVDASRGASPVALHNVVSEKKIEPALRSNVSRLRFSPNGRWILAQDDSSTYVFARDGLAFSFRIDSPDAYGAQFSADSSAIVFYDQNYRVERWGVESKQREWVYELAMNPSCLQTALSPDGRTMACATSEFGLRVFDVASGAVIFEKASFYRPNFLDLFAVLSLFSAEPNPHFFEMHFSPDAQYLVVARGSDYVALDVPKRQAFTLPGAIRDRIGTSFAFVGSDRLIGIRYDKPEDSGILTFPKGEMVAKLNLGHHSVAMPTRGDSYVLVGQVAPLIVGLFSVKDKKLTGGSRLPGFDMYDDVFVSELRSGEIALQKVGSDEVLKMAQVPIGPLAALRAADISPDFRLLAVSQSSRGAIWDLETGKSLLLRGFRGTQIDGARQAYVDFPRDDKVQRAIFRMDPNSRAAEPLVVIEPPQLEGAPPPNPALVADAIKGAAKVTAEMVTQCGAYLVGYRKEGKKADSSVLAVFDAKTGRELWTRPLGPRSGGAVNVQPQHNSLTLRWNYASDAAKAIVGKNPALVRQFQALKAEKEAVGLIEVLDLPTGRVKGDVLVDFGGGSFAPATTIASGDQVIIGDNENRTLVYSLTTGKLLGRAFGSVLDLATGAARVCVQNAPGEVTIYSVPEMRKVDELQFPSAALLARFSPDGSRLFVLTRDQTAYTIDLAAAKTQ